MSAATGRATLSAAWAQMRSGITDYMAKILIIADDLTGAADCGAMFAERGFAATVLLAGCEEGAVKADDWRDADVLAIDADTRGAGPDDAAACAARIVQDACSGPAAEATVDLQEGGFHAAGQRGCGTGRRAQGNARTGFAIDARGDHFCACVSRLRPHYRERSPICEWRASRRFRCVAP